METVLQAINNRLIAIDAQVESLQFERVKLNERASAIKTLLNDKEGVLLLRKALK